MLISDKIEFKTKKVIRDKKRHYIMIKGQSNRKIKHFINIYAPRIGHLNFGSKY